MPELNGQNCFKRTKLKQTLKWSISLLTNPKTSLKLSFSYHSPAPNLPPLSLVTASKRNDDLVGRWNEEPCQFAFPSLLGPRAAETEIEDGPKGRLEALPFPF